MIEVEETSDLMITILQGLHSRRQPIFDKIYKDLDQSFPSEHEVRRRFRHCMDIVEDELGRDLRALEFSRKALFNTLFSFVYDEAYGLGSKLTATKPSTLPKAFWAAIRTASSEIRSPNLPENVAKALRGATSDLGSRRRRLEFLKQVFKRVAT
jgi:hypothetical protein